MGETAREYRVCVRCVMDTSDPYIEFDEKGLCNHCRSYGARASEFLSEDDGRIQKLEAIVEEIKRKGRRKEYDCVIGVSGGVDSTYVAYTVKRLGLRPLAVHMDNGWDSGTGGCKYREVPEEA